MKRLFAIAALLAALPLAAQDTATLDGEPAIRFVIGHGHLATYCDGVLYLTATRVRYDGVSDPTHSFDYRRSEVSTFHAAHFLMYDYIKLEAGGHNYRLLPFPNLERQFGDRIAFLERAYTDFPGAAAEVKRAEAERPVPAGAVHARLTPAGPVLDFPVLAGPGVFWFGGGEKNVTPFAAPTAGGEAYVVVWGTTSRGTLEVTSERVRFASTGDPVFNFDSPKSEFRLASGVGGYPRIVANIRTAGKTSVVLGEVTAETVRFKGKPVPKILFYDVAPLLRALGPDFGALAAELLPRPVLVVVAGPGAEIFVDEQRAGVAGADGTLRVTPLAPGPHKIRATLAGYQPWEGAVALASGDEKRLETKLVALPPPPPPAPPKPAGPPALALGDIVKMLTGGVAPRRVGALVQERGVDFALDDASEKQIRGAGGDAELLVVIAKAKR